MPRQIIRLPLSISRDPRHREICKRCIEQRLGKQPGIDNVRVISDPTRTDHEEHHHAQIELEFDPGVVSLAQINSYLRQAGGCRSDTTTHVVLPVEGIASPRHEQTIAVLLDKLPGVTATVSYASQNIRLEFDRRLCALPRILARLEQLGISLRERGFRALQGVSTGPIGPGAVSKPMTEWRRALGQPDLAMAILAGLFLVGGFLVHLRQGPEELRIALLMGSYVMGGFYPAQEALATLRRWRLDIDMLMFAAAFGAAALGHYEEGAMLLFLFSLGGAGERLAMNRARRAIQALAKLAPQTAMLIGADGSRREVGVEDLRVDDQVLVQPGEQVPADGVIAGGASAINQAPITGESAPVEKSVGQEVYAGTINGDGAITVRVSRPAFENKLAKVIRLVEEAQTTKSPTQLFTARVERWYVPLVVLGTAGLIVIPPLAGWQPNREHANDWAGWFYQAMAFLTAASPCALAIGTPAAVLSGIARAARSGVLIKGGMHLENLGRVRAVAFDKTGTLTRGRLQVTDVICLNGTADETSLLAKAAALERASRHPIAEAIANEAQARGCAELMADEIEQTPGVGIRGKVQDRLLAVGRWAALAKNLSDSALVRERVESLESQGKTTVVVVEGDQAMGIIGLLDLPRPDARRTIEDLVGLGIRHTIMLTGDNSRTAAAVAAQVGVEEYLGDLLPEDKLSQVRELDRKYRRVAMVGDGVNDAPAMANATVGIALGGATGAGSDVALETADIALLADDLGKLPEAMGISRFARRIILQNLGIALGVIVVLAPVAALGMTPISAAVLFHEGSTVLVVLNALRILGYKAPR